ncbi:MAG: HAD family hydrolase [Chloroflexi bacterium]|nr:HAD family hydrolase [Chloroflexota bacterium]
MESVKAVFFDLDNTLCDYWASSRQALTDVMDMVGGCYPGRDMDTMRRDYFRVSREAQAAAGSPGFLHDFSRAERFAAMLHRHEIRDEELATRLADLFESQIIARLTLFNDALPVLDTLKPRMYIGVLSNGHSAVQREKLAALNIGHYFERVFISEEIGIAKPDPAIFGHVLEATGFAPSEVAYVGDSQDQDVPGAQIAGIVSVWLNRRNREPDPAYPLPDHMISTLTEMLPLLGYAEPALR